MRLARTVEDVNVSLKELYDFKRKIETLDIVMHGRKIIDAALASKLGDYVPKSELEISNSRIKALETKITNLEARIIALENA